MKQNPSTRGAFALSSITDSTKPTPMKTPRLLTLIAAITAVGCTATGSDRPHMPSFVNLLRPPDAVTVVTEETVSTLVAGNGTFTGSGVEVQTTCDDRSLAVSLTAPEAAVKHLKFHWNGKLPDDGWKYLGDAWERGNGNLEWNGRDHKRVMPWYFLASDGKLTHGYGVKTGPAAACGWQTDADGITLDMDVRNGGCGVRLGTRRLDVCTIVMHEGKSGESPFAAAQAFCRQMCPNPRIPKEPVYGFNDWYCDYGENSAESVRYYADYIVRLSPQNGTRPFMVIDDGWHVPAWIRGNKQFPSMPGIAADIKKAGAKPGIWIRLLTARDQPAAWRSAHKDGFLDPSVPEVIDLVKERVARLRGWGFQLIKHDYSTVDITGVWCSAVAADNASWHFADPSKTTSEIIRNFYLAIREAAGDDTLVMGCQTVSHLSAGIFDLMRIGGDTSGKDWDRVRTMGVNALAFRGFQHGTFYSADADCVGLTQAEQIPWTLNRQWLNLVARSGTPLFISFKQGSLTPEQEKEVAAALEIAAKPQILAEPLDWFNSRTPAQWNLMGEKKQFNWGRP